MPNNSTSGTTIGGVTLFGFLKMIEDVSSADPIIWFRIKRLISRILIDKEGKT